MTYDPRRPTPTFRPRGLRIWASPIRVRTKTGKRLVETSCYWCGGGFFGRCYRTREHLTPLSAGGDSSPANIAAACAPCNHSRGSIPHDEWRDAIDEVMKRWPHLDQHEIGPRALQLHRAAA